MKKYILIIILVFPIFLFSSNFDLNVEDVNREYYTPPPYKNVKIDDKEYVLSPEKYTVCSTELGGRKTCIEYKLTEK